MEEQEKIKEFNKMPISKAVIKNIIPAILAIRRMKENVLN